MKRSEGMFLLLCTLGALLVHGYHPFSEDAEIYLPNIEKILHPELFPVGAEFFQPYARASLFPRLIAASVHLTHLPFGFALFLWEWGSVLMLLLACWELSGKLFTDARARWAGVGLIAALLTLPVAGTALYIMDQYINPRNLCAFASIFAVARVLDRKYLRAGLWLAFGAAMHPLMAFFAASYCALLFCMEKFQPRIANFAFLPPLGFWLQPASRAYHEVALYHPSHYILRWHWYEWLGIFGPIAVLWWFARMARSRQIPHLNVMCRALILYDSVYFAGALVLSVPARFESLARFQPLRSLHLLYILLFLFTGCLLGQDLLKNRAWRWVALFVPLCAGMFLAQRSLFPASAHVEWPWAAPKNEWAQAFLWVRSNTPPDAVFALGPLHMEIRGEDENGFRAIAQRSMLADAIKDAGAASMFPSLADEWFEQVQAQRGWKQFQLEDFQRLRAKFGVSWVVVQQPGASGLDCPYWNRAVLVCRLK